jgi:hypothetical protein
LRAKGKAWRKTGWGRYAGLKLGSPSPIVEGTRTTLVWHLPRSYKKLDFSCLPRALSALILIGPGLFCYFVANSHLLNLSGFSAAAHALSFLPILGMTVQPGEDDKYEAMKQAIEILEKEKIRGADPEHYWLRSEEYRILATAFQATTVQRLKDDIVKYILKHMAIEVYKLPRYFFNEKIPKEFLRDVALPALYPTLEEVKIEFGIRAFVKRWRQRIFDEARSQGLLMRKYQAEAMADRIEIPLDTVRPYSGDDEFDERSLSNPSNTVELEMSELFSADASASAEQASEGAFISRTIIYLLSKIGRRNRLIVNLAFGNGCENEQPWKQKIIGLVLSITESRVNQVLTKELKRLNELAREIKDGDAIPAAKDGYHDVRMAEAFLLALKLFEEFEPQEVKLPEDCDNLLIEFTVFMGAKNIAPALKRDLNSSHAAIRLILNNWDNFKKFARWLGEENVASTFRKDTASLLLILKLILQQLG